MENKPLAHRLRPTDFTQIAGQSHLLGESGPIRRLIESQQPTNILLWGPPGIGKTSIAQLLNQTWQTEWMNINATLSNIKDIKTAIEAAKVAKTNGKVFLLFIDELHRFSKTQQDALLSVVEDGT